MAPRLRAGFSLFEVVVVICLVGIFASILLDRVLRYQEIAEKTAMETTLGALRSAQVLQLGARIIHGGLPAAAKLADENPIEWLAEPPPGYLGALHDASIANVPKGSWYFDLKNKELIYRPQRTRFLVPGPDGSDRLRFRVVVKLEGIEKAVVPSIAELGIRPVVPINWDPGF